MPVVEQKGGPVKLPLSIVLCLLPLAMRAAAAGPASQPASELSLDAGGSVRIKLVLIPAGKFFMGSLADEKGREADEGPRHEVTISKPFYMGITEVTQAQYIAVVNRNPSAFQSPRNPVESVSWEQASQFCANLSQHTGRCVHLPTEAQWEYACRAGTQTRFSCGDDEAKLPEYAWHQANAGQTTHKVGGLQPNAFGLYDLHGNVAEWCADWYADKYPDGPETDPQGPAQGKFRVLRGGSWSSAPAFCRSAYRGWSLPSARNSGAGFRIVVDVADSDSLSAAKPPATAPVPPAAPNSLGMRFVHIKPGEFLMGGDRAPSLLAKDLGGDADWYRAEQPQHKVQIAEGFLLAIHEVTVGQFAAFVKDTGYKTDAEKDGSSWAWDGKNWGPVKDANWRKPGFEQTDQHPVVCVSYNDAIAFCKWLGRKEGQTYRLPSEAEWEYACRAGRQTLFPWGDSPADGKGHANCADAAALARFHDWTESFKWDDGFVYTAPVGSFKPNAWGLYDMIGNAAELCGEWSDYGGDDPFADAPPPAKPDPSERVLRGGSWHDNARFCRCAYRFWTKPALSSYHVGFRVAMEMPEP